MIKDTKQAIRTKSTNWKAIAELERNRRMELQKKLSGLQGYHRHLEDECCQLEKQSELLLTRIQKSESFSDNAARIIKQHEFKSNILEKENVRLKHMINSKNNQIKEDETRIQKLSEASKGLFEELQLSREHIKSLEEKIYTIERDHKISLQKAGDIVDDYFKYKFLDSGIPNAEVVLEPKIKKNKTRILALSKNISSDDKQHNDEFAFEVNTEILGNNIDIELGNPNFKKPAALADDDFEKQLKFLENMNF